MGEQDTDLGERSLAIYVALAVVLAGVSYSKYLHLITHAVAVVFILLIVYVLRQSCARMQWGWNDAWGAAPGAVAAFFAERCKNVFKATPGLGLSQEFNSIRSACANMPPIRILLPVPVATTRGRGRSQRPFNVSVGVGGRRGGLTPSL